MVPCTSSNLLIISATRACRPGYQRRSAAAPFKDHAIPSLSLTSVWLCITLLTSKAYCSNENFPIWVESPLNVLNFGILPTTCEATLGQDIFYTGSGSGLGNCVLVPSTNTLTSLPTWHNHVLAIISLGVATLHPVWTNHISIKHNVLHIFFNIFIFWDWGYGFSWWCWHHD